MLFAKIIIYNKLNAGKSRQKVFLKRLDGGELRIFLMPILIALLELKLSKDFFIWIYSCIFETKPQLKFNNIHILTLRYKQETMFNFPANVSRYDTFLGGFYRHK